MLFRSSVVLTPATLRTTVLTGAALQGFLDRAQQEGYGPVRFKGFRSQPNLNGVCDARSSPVLAAHVGSIPLPLACRYDLDCPIDRRPCLRGVCSREPRVDMSFYFPPFGEWKTGLVEITLRGRLNAVNNFIETAEFRAFAGPPLMPFWKITNLFVHHDWPASTISVIEGPPLQPPERIIRVERTTRFDSAMTVLCIVAACTNDSQCPFDQGCQNSLISGIKECMGTVRPPSSPLPSFHSVTVVGPDGRDPLEAFPCNQVQCGPGTLPPIRIPPGGFIRP